MEVIVAKSAGFCFGVQRAVEQVYEHVESGLPVYTYGPIIHNEQVVEELEGKGVVTLYSEHDLERISHKMNENETSFIGKVVVRSHGIGKSIQEKIEKSHFTCVDATCPFVKRIHKIVEEESEKGSKIVIIGNKEHPEVEGIQGWSTTPTIVVESEVEAENVELERGEKVCIVSQTTFNYNKFQDLVDIFLKKRYDISVVNTICCATEERQSEARKIAASVDLMIIIGGRHSSNTRKLYEICKEECTNTYFIQTLDDLNNEMLQSVSLVGITAGASTPNNIIEEVQNYVRINF
ncbi:MAG: 4-hydroxy-3-methylbut-2-enyl diphosphate reductase [Eubacteriales bacterium]